MYKVLEKSFTTRIAKNNDFQTAFRRTLTRFSQDHFVLLALLTFVINELNPYLQFPLHFKLKLQIMKHFGIIEFSDFVHRPVL
jgi:hypothetical protein